MLVIMLMIHTDQQFKRSTINRSIKLSTNGQQNKRSSNNQQFKRSTNDQQFKRSMINQTSKSVLHLIVPVRGQQKLYERFMTNLIKHKRPEWDIRVFVIN